LFLDYLQHEGEQQIEHMLSSADMSGAH